jgi:DNA-directed RNA polymerase sigma subunit (sigma70/sigma32)
LQGRISREEEVRLSRAVQESLKLPRFRPATITQRRGKTGIYTSPTFQELAETVNLDDSDTRRVFFEGLKARDELVSANLRLVYSSANRFKGHLSPAFAADVAQEGVLGLVRAAEKYDATMGFAFSTYAVRWVRSSMANYVRIAQSSVRVPQEINSITRKIEKYRSSTAQPENLSAKQIAHALDLQERQVAAILLRSPTHARIIPFSEKTADSVQFNVELSSAPYRGGSTEIIFAGQGLWDSSYDDQADDVGPSLHDLLRKVLTTNEWNAVCLRFGIGKSDEAILTNPQVTLVI